MIELRGVSKTAAEARILRGVDLIIGRGEMVGLLGPSGAGKTTLLNLIAGIDSPSEGEVIVDGVRLAELSRRDLALFRRDTIGMVFQQYHLLPNLTAVENVSLPLQLKGIGVKEAHARAMASLDSVGIPTKADSYPDLLSGGERQRTAIARAIIGEPPVLLADEPTGSLDSATGAQILDLLLRLHTKLGMTLLVVTHDSAVAQRCGRILRLSDGRLVNSADPR